MEIDYAFSVLATIVITTHFIRLRRARRRAEDRRQSAYYRAARDELIGRLQRERECDEAAYTSDAPLGGRSGSQPPHR